MSVEGAAGREEDKYETVLMVVGEGVVVGMMVLVGAAVDGVGGDEEKRPLKGLDPMIDAVLCFSGNTPPPVPPPTDVSASKTPEGIWPSLGP